MLTISMYQTYVVRIKTSTCTLNVCVMAKCLGQHLVNLTTSFNCDVNLK